VLLNATEQNQVTVNYRLGLFGWLGGDRFMDEGGMPNVGLWDQQFALRWVRDSIYMFGGDVKRYVGLYFIC